MLIGSPRTRTAHAPPPPPTLIVTLFTPKTLPCILARLPSLDKLNDSQSELPCIAFNIIFSARVRTKHHPRIPPTASRFLAAFTKGRPNTPKKILYGLRHSSVGGHPPIQGHPSPRLNAIYLWFSPGFQPAFRCRFRIFKHFIVVNERKRRRMVSALWPDPGY